MYLPHTYISKKYIEYSKSDYQPFITLVAFGNIFEHVIASQLNECLCHSFLSAYRKHYGAETNCRIAYNLGILLMNSNCFAMFFSSILVMSVQISIL